MGNNVSDSFVMLDLRSIKHGVSDQMQSLMTSLDQVPDDGIVKLTTSTRPDALIESLQTQANRFNVRQLAEDAIDVEILGPHAPEIMDLTDLEAPGPMEKVLLACSRLEAGQSILARLPRVPVMLFPHLDKRGLSWCVHEEADQSALLMVRKAQ